MTTSACLWQPGAAATSKLLKFRGFWGKSTIHATPLDGHQPGKYICVFSLAPKAADLSSSEVLGLCSSFTACSPPWLCLLLITESPVLGGQVHWLQ